MQHATKYWIIENFTNEAEPRVFEGCAIQPFWYICLTYT